jgi:aspartyl-tRNA synthetase
MHRYRTHNCGALRLENAGNQARLSGWVHRKRDHGNLVFVDIRDQFGVTQCVVDTSSPVFSTIDSARSETVLCVTGKVVERTADTINERLPTGKVEVQIEEVEVLSQTDVLPIQVYGDNDYPEDLRLKYRYLDLRREEMRNNILLRSKVISSIRNRMVESGFVEFQTPILTASSPEGARDFLVPSRLHPGRFSRRPHRSSSSLSWCPASTVISKSRRVFVMKTAVPTAHPASSINSIWRWRLSHKTMCLLR